MLGIRQIAPRIPSCPKLCHVQFWPVHHWPKVVLFLTKEMGPNYRNTIPWKPTMPWGGLLQLFFKWQCRKKHSGIVWWAEIIHEMNYWFSDATLACFSLPFTSHNALKGNASVNSAWLPTQAAKEAQTTPQHLLSYCVKCLLSRIQMLPQQHPPNSQKQHNHVLHMRREVQEEIPPLW